MGAFRAYRVCGACMDHQGTTGRLASREGSTPKPQLSEISGFRLQALNPKP